MMFYWFNYNFLNYHHYCAMNGNYAGVTGIKI